MSVASERRAFQALVAAEREAAAAVEDALTSAEFSGASQQVRTLAAEVLHLRACIERCKSVQREIEALAENEIRSPKRLDAYRKVCAKLAKALEGS